MKGNNDLRKKGRALFLAAIMVVSMVAMSATFAGAAAAQDNPDMTFNASDETAQPGETVTVTLDHIAEEYNGSLTATTLIIDYDPAALNYSAAANGYGDFAPVGMSVSNDAAAGELEIAHTAEAGETFEPSTGAAEVQFEVASDATDGDVLSLTLADADQGAADENESDLANVVGDDGSITVGSSGGQAGPFSVSNLSPAQASANSGDSLTVTADVTNDGDAAGSTQANFTLDGDVIASQDVNDLGAGNTTQVSFDVTAPQVDNETDFTHAVETPDNSQTGTLTVSPSDDGGDDGNISEDDYDVSYSFGNLGERVWQGQVVRVTGLNAGEDIEVLTFNDGAPDAFQFQRTANQDGEVLLNTADLDQNDYVVDRPDTGQTSSDFPIAEHNLRTFDIDKDTVRQDDTATLNIDSNRADFSLAISETEQGLSGEEIATVFSDDVVDSVGDNSVVVSFDNTGEPLEMSFNQAPLGNHTFQADATDTTASASDDVEVTEPLEGTIQFDSSSYNQNRGDVVTFGVDFEGVSDSVVRIEDSASDYRANLSVQPNDDGNATIQWNTFQAGTGNPDAAFTALEGDVTVVDETDVVTDRTPRIVEDDYDLTSFLVDGDSTNFTEEDIDEEDVATIFVSEPEERALGATPWVAPAGAFNAGDVAPQLSADEREAILGSVTQRDQVANQDLAVIQFEAQGVFGYLQDAEGNFDPEDQGLSLQVLGPEGRYADRASWGVGDDGVELVESPANNDFFLVLDTEEVENADGQTLQANTNYEVRFSIAGDTEAGGNDYLGADASQQASTSFDHVPRTVEITGIFEDDVLQVPNGAETELSATTTVAPGSEIFMRARARSPAPFLQDTTVEVAEDGTASATFDFSDRDTETNFTVTARDTEGDARDQVDAVFTESEGEEPAFFGVSGLSPQSTTVSPGDSVEVTATVTNEGDVAGNQTVEFQLDGETIDSQDLSLDPGESTEVSFSTSAPEEAGDYTHAVVSANQTADGTLTVEDQGEDDSEDDSSEDDSSEDDSSEDDSSEDDMDDGNQSDDTGGDDDQPGFGIALALIAILGAALLARRRQN